MKMRFALLALLLTAIECCNLIFSDSQDWKTPQLKVDKDLATVILGGHDGYFNAWVKTFYVPCTKEKFLQFLSILSRDSHSLCLEMLQPSCKSAFLKISKIPSQITSPSSNSQILSNESICQLIKEWYYSFSNAIHLHSVKNDIVIKNIMPKNRWLIKSCKSKNFIRCANDTGDILLSNGFFYCNSSVALNVKMISFKKERKQSFDYFYVGPFDDCFAIGGENAQRKLHVFDILRVMEALDFSYVNEIGKECSKKNSIEEYLFWSGESLQVAVPLLILDGFPFENLHDAFLGLKSLFPDQNDVFERAYKLINFESAFTTSVKIKRKAEELDELPIDVENVSGDSEAKTIIENENTPSEKIQNSAKLTKRSNVLLQENFVAFIEQELQKFQEKD